jgi:hypothetical protein
MTVCVCQSSKSLTAGTLTSISARKGYSFLLGL